MAEEIQPIREIVAAILDWIPDKVVQFLKWYQPIQVVVVENDCWWNVGLYRNEPTTSLDAKFMLTNRSNSLVEIIGFTPTDKRIIKDIHSMIHVIQGNQAIEPIIAPNTTAMVQILNVFQPVITDETENLTLKSVIKNSLGKNNSILIKFKSRKNR